MSGLGSWLGEREKSGGLILLLVLSMTSVRAIPFASVWGADFQNILVYHTCSKGRNPYLIPGAVCGDIIGRPMIYPPLLFHSFFWSRGLTLEAAMYLWSVFTVVACLGCLWAWRRMLPTYRRDSADWLSVAFGLLLIVQFPMMFALERGNVEIGAVLAWTAAAFLLCRNRVKMAGLAAGLAAAYKLYPAIPCAAAVLGMFWAVFDPNQRRKANFFRFGFSALLSFVIVHAIYFRESVLYFTKILPKFTAQRVENVATTHSIPTVCGKHDTFCALVCLGLFGTWVWASRRGLREQPALTMAGLLAMSTYFAGVSHDYNLITTYPLLMLLLVRAKTSGRYGLLLLGLIAIVGDRRLFADDTSLILNPTSHLALQLAWLVLVAIEVGAPSPTANPCGPILADASD